MFDGKIKVGYRLGLDALGGIHHKQGAFAGSDGPGYLVRKVYMPRCVDKVEHVFLSLEGVFHLDGMALYRDAFLPLEIHGVQHLRLHFPAAQRIGNLKHPVRKRALAVVDMGYNAKIPCIVHV